MGPQPFDTYGLHKRLTAASCKKYFNIFPYFIEPGKRYENRIRWIDKHLEIRFHHHMAVIIPLTSKFRQDEKDTCNQHIVMFFPAFVSAGDPSLERLEG